MKKILLLLLFTLPLMAAAQRGPRFEENRERIEAQKIAYLTEKLNLSPAEAQQFWPVYNEFNAKREKILERTRERHRKLRMNEEGGISEEEASRLADEELVEAQQMLDLRKSYHQQFKSVLPASKVLRLYKAEDEFKRVLLERLRIRHQQRGGR
jgi:hypothetical protein